MSYIDNIILNKDDNILRAIANFFLESLKILNPPPIPGIYWFHYPIIGSKTVKKNIQIDPQTTKILSGKK